MWHNRFGNLTAIRFEDKSLDDIKFKLAEELDPLDFGLYFRPILKNGLQASIESVDFAELFIGLSFFIVLSALLLTGMLFVLTVEQRSREMGLFLALGIPSKFVKRFILLQGAVLALLGTILGIIFSMIYNQIVLFALKTIWRDAVGTSDLIMYIDSFTVIIGAVLSIVLIMLTLWLVVRKQTSRSIVKLQSGSSKIDTASPKEKSRVSFIIAMLCLIVVFIIVITTDPARGGGALFSFFSAGFLLLLSGILFADVFIKKSSYKTDVSKLTLAVMGIRNTARRKMRSLTLIGLLASGLFIVFTVGANRHGMIKDAHSRASGTGGFALFAETVIPILYDLNSDKGRQFYGIDEIDSSTVEFVQFRVREGDDASCLNLNRVSNPQLLGVKPELLARRRAFTFSKLTEQVDDQNPWLALDQNYNDVIPAIADETVIIWGLGKTVGDTLEYRDETGRTFKIKLIAGLANSIFQGNLIISESAFIEKYPSHSGYNLFLIDAHDQNINRDQLFQNLSWALQDFGIDLVTATERLSAFNKVENTYLSIFLILGGLGLILGTIGIGIIVLRNVLERKGELAILRAVGYNRNSLNTLLLSEHYFLLLWGILCGIVAALISALPALMSPGVDIPYLTILVLLIAMVLSGGFWVYMSTVLAIRGDLLPALRNE
jgi:putative ABC transport system permease protein